MRKRSKSSAIVRLVTTLWNNRIRTMALLSMSLLTVWFVTLYSLQNDTYRENMERAAIAANLEHNMEAKRNR